LQRCKITIYLTDLIHKWKVKMKSAQPCLYDWFFLKKV
jgi:hypothetical protein